MPDGRTIGGQRESITRSGGTIATNGNLSNRQPIGTRTVGSSVTSTPQAPGMAQSEIDRINALIRQNVSKYIDVPWNEAFEGRGILPGRDGTVSDVPAIPFPKNPFETLADAFLKGFGGATYNPPLQQQSYGYGSTGGTNFTVILILGAIGVAIYYFYFKS